MRPGQLRTGAVKNITDFGVFIDLDGLDGLLHIADMSWGRIAHPSEMVKIGEAVEVMILDVDREKGRVSLGLKQKSHNPWEGIESKYPVGSKVKRQGHQRRALWRICGTGGGCRGAWCMFRSCRG